MNVTPRLANYISRYAPSRKKVISYLEKKNYPSPVALLDEISYSESLMCDMWIRSFVSLGKGKREISMKLMKKEFPKEMILEKLEAFDLEIHDWEGNRMNILNQIQSLEQRGKSRRMISSLLISRYPYFRDEITGVLTETIDTDNLQKEVQKYKNRYNIEDNQVYTLEQKKLLEKIIASLLRKGFSYSDIKNSLKGNN